MGTGFKPRFVSNKEGKIMSFMRETKSFNFQVAGALFVYQREAAPKYGFMIMNRNSKENMVEVVTTDLTFQVEISAYYLLYWEDMRAKR